MKTKSKVFSAEVKKNQEEEKRGRAKRKKQELYNDFGNNQLTEVK